MAAKQRPFKVQAMHLSVFSDVTAVQKCKVYTWCFQDNTTKTNSATKNRIIIKLELKINIQHISNWSIVDHRNTHTAKFISVELMVLINLLALKTMNKKIKASHNKQLHIPYLKRGHKFIPSQAFQYSTLGILEQSSHLQSVPKCYILPYFIITGIIMRIGSMHKYL
jgi:hypothetical protein